jgi:hypothetical protein
MIVALAHMIPHGRIAGNGGQKLAPAGKGIVPGEREIRGLHPSGTPAIHGVAA